MEGTPKVTRKRLGRFATLLTAAMTASMLIGAGTVSAANPNWDITITPTPAKVGVNHDAGYVVTIVNNGPSQINDLSVTLTALEDPTATPTHLSGLDYNVGTDRTCAPAVPQTCALGTFDAGVSVTFTIAYAVLQGKSAMCKNELNQNVVCFRLEVSIRAGTGDTGSDGKGKSRGDAYKETAFAEIGSGDFDGGFVVNADVYQTNPSLGTRNIQATRLERAAELVPVTIEDGIPTLASCDSTDENVACGGLFGEWSRLNVNNGNGGVNFGTPFKVTLTIRGGPGGGAADDIAIIHVLDNGTIEVISQACTFSGTDPVPTNPECLVATKSGSVWTIEVWLKKNGSIRGGI